ncbi:hypothetical protein OG417_07680 [Actinoallomurus sp. NBC_01490]|uniref:hypothetical protein n=1 Tax=Actinoallomurus sp. NBC_01490 TaxID=2903557 RepID=UPI002E375982|nr:hypothetical protein [Actinoallomurus sp. NBC_01490]
MRTAVASALATAVALAALTGCSGGSHEQARTKPVAAESSPDTSPPPVPLTPEVAKKAFQSFVINEDVARASGDERLALWWTSEGQSQLTAAAFRRAMTAGDPVPRYRYGTPTLYVPRLKPEGQQWFVASVRRSLANGKSPHTVLMGFVKSKPTMRWRLSLATLLDKKQKPPKIAVDDQGYAKPLATFDTGLLIPPRDVPSIQATLAEEGPGNVAAKVMATGKHTTSYYISDQKATKPKKGSGLKVDTVYATTSFPIFPLATTDGGGIVLYALSRDAVSTKPKKKPGHVPIPKDAAPFVASDLVHNELDVTQTLQFATLVPPAPKKDTTSTEKAVIIAADGGTIKASVPTK